MAFTHEDGYLDGPYFAVHPNYQKLNKDNLEHIQKIPARTGKLKMLDETDGCKKKPTN